MTTSPRLSAMGKHPILEFLDKPSRDDQLKPGIIIGVPEIELSAEEWQAIANHIYGIGKEKLVKQIFNKLLTSEDKNWLHSEGLDYYDLCETEYSAAQSDRVTKIMIKFNECLGIKFFDIEDEENYAKQVIEETIAQLDDLKNSIPGDDEVNSETHSHLMDAYNSIEAAIAALTEGIASLHSALSLM